MKILITGGSGFIGSYLAEYLLKNGHQVIIVDNLSTGRLANIRQIYRNENLEIHIDTIFNKKLMNSLVKNCEQIYHLAAAVGVRFIVDNPVQTIETNVAGTEIMIQLANQYKKKIFIASTSEIYGKANSLPFKEGTDRIYGSTNIRRWSYAESKAIDEFLALAYWHEKKLPVVIGRLFNTIGPRQTGQYGMVVPRFVQQALLGHPITVYGDGKQSRCFTYVGDIVNALVKLMNEEKCVGEVYNIGSDKEITIMDLAKKVKKLTNSLSKIKFIPYNEAYEEGFEDMRRRVPDISKAKKDIGFEPKVPLDDILKEIIEYYKK
ncbi:MAG: GDP-mannose 4,6-dehydratase [Candidatus Cloacimonadota bacterium]|nr:GDP-mannose 4,6-dehydratase [Candidatus Cloacimonadota bacterium]